MNVFGEHFGENLRRIRKSRGLTQRALAEAVGLHESHIHCLEKGRYLPRICTAQRVADGLGVPMAELLRDKNTTKRGGLTCRQ